MNIHVKPIRYQDEMQCPYCGKCWGISEEPPPCETKKEHTHRKISEIKIMLSGKR